MTTATLPPQEFATFGDLLKYLRRRQHLTQLELSVAVGYSEAQITRLEKNQRLPDLTALRALFIPALGLEDDPRLAARLLELAEAARQEAAPAPGLPPYKGLLFFDESDADLFFGRESLTAGLADRVVGLGLDGRNRFLAVVGASGSGKSSLMRAGLAVALRRAGWGTRVFTPTSDPLRVLENQLGSLPAGEGSSRILLVVDQFEETFTLCRSEAARSAFIEKLLTLSSAPATDHPAAAVVIALRADFYSHCAQYPALRGAVAAEQEYIGQMTSGELRRAIEEPARQGGWEFEPGLVDILMQDLGADGAESPEPGALPLLSHALLATWERRRGHTLTLQGYHASGGVRGAIAETAENIFTDQLDRQQKELAHDIFLRLTELGEGTEDTRRRATLTELARRADEGAALRAVLDILADARLIILNEDSAEVAHEALIREWQRLHEWLTEDREGLRLHRHLTETTQEWERRGREASELYRGARLAQAVEWAGANDQRLNPAERDFLEASVEQEQRDALEREVLHQRELEAAQRLAEEQSRRAEEQAQSARRLRRRAYLLGGAFALAILLAAAAVFFGQRAATSAASAREQQQLAFARELAASAINNLSVDPERSALLALQSARVSMQDGKPVLPEAEDALQRSVGSMRLLATWQAHKEAISSMALSSDGKKLATISPDGTAKAWETASGQLIRTIPVDAAIAGCAPYADVSLDWGHLTVAFSPDGGRLLIMDHSCWAGLWDLGTGKKVRGFYGDTLTIAPNSSVFSPDGRLVAAGSALPGGYTLWDAGTGQQLRGSYSGHGDHSGQIVFSPDGGLLYASGDHGLASSWDVATGELVRTFGSALNINPPNDAIALSPDGSRLATGGTDAAVRVWDASSGELQQTFFGHSSRIAALAFSADGRLLASASDDGTARVWDLKTGREWLTLAGHAGGVSGVAFSPGGDRLYTASRDGTVKVWDITAAGANNGLNLQHPGSVSSAAYSPDGTRLATWNADGTAALWDTKNGKQLHLLSQDASPYGGNASFSPDGKQLAVVSGNTALVYDVQTGKLLRSLPPFAAAARTVAFSPDGKRIAVGTISGIISIDAPADEGGSRLFSTSIGGFLWQVTFSPDGGRLATANTQGTAVWDVATGERLIALTEGGRGLDSRAVAFSPDGRLIATTGADGYVRIWDAGSGEQLHVLTGFTGPTLAVAFSPDGGSLAASSRDQTLKLWQISADGSPLALPLTLYGNTGPVNSVAFSPDGAKLVTAGAEGPVRIYALDIQDLITLARSRLTRGLTPEECRQYLHLDTCPAEP